MLTTSTEQYTVCVQLLKAITGKKNHVEPVAWSGSSARYTLPLRLPTPPKNS